MEIIEITIVVKRADQPATITQIKDNVKAMQTIVGGYFELLELFRTDDRGTIDLVFNENGQDLDLPLNFVINGHEILGDAFLIKHDFNGNVVSLNHKEIKMLTAMMVTPSSNPADELFW